MALGKRINFVQSARIACAADRQAVDVDQRAVLEDGDELLARDAYDEFAKAPYDVVKALKPKMNHDQLVGRLVLQCRIEIVQKLPVQAR